ncbi:MAG: hypothetical protein ABL909_02610 [Sphingopyxis sp.]
MTTTIPFVRPLALSPLAILALLMMVLLPRLALMLIAPVEPQSDALSYLSMAEHLAAGRPMQDMWGQYAFYSAGYPLLLGSTFALTGPSLSVALAVNLVLALVTLSLLLLIVRQVGGGAMAQGFAGIGYALWIPAAYGSGVVQRENLSTPLLMAVVMALLALAAQRHLIMAALLGGASFGFGLIAGASGALVGLLFPVALLRLWRGAGLPTALRAGALAALALALTVGPWLAYTKAQLGTPVLNSNGGFNFYLGNNPAATGAYVGIEKTQMGPQWNVYLAQRGEVEAARGLQEQAVHWIAEHPAAAARLALTKLALFWQPNVPDSADRAGGPAIVVLRWIDVAQFTIALLLAGAGALLCRRTHPRIGWLMGAVGLFWMLHGAAYVMPRYREPVMPLLLILAALALARSPLSTFIERWFPRIGKDR